MFKRFTYPIFGEILDFPIFKKSLLNGFLDVSLDDVNTQTFTKKNMLKFQWYQFEDNAMSRLSAQLIFK